MNVIDNLFSDKVCVYMKRGFGWSTASGVKFTSDQPFQMMDNGEAELLIKNSPDRFKKATQGEVETFFKTKPNTKKVYSSDKQADDIIAG